MYVTRWSLMVAMAALFVLSAGMAQSQAEPLTTGGGGNASTMPNTLPSEGVGIRILLSDNERGTPFQEEGQPAPATQIAPKTVAPLPPAKPKPLPGVAPVPDRAYEPAPAVTRPAPVPVPIPSPTPQAAPAPKPLPPPQTTPAPSFVPLPSVTPPPKATAKPEPPAATYGEAWCDTVPPPCAAPCQPPTCATGECPPAACDVCDPRWTLPQPCFLQSRGIIIGGWLDQGITFNWRHSQDGFNGVVTFNDRDSEYQMNQLNLFLKKDIDTSGGGWDIGGRVDVLYGTDAQFVESRGLESSWVENQRFYQVAVPQFYTDVGWNDWKLRMGHFYSPIGYEVVPGPDNFFYSHSYTFQYGEPRTYTGALVSRELTDRFTVSGGVERGWDTFRDVDSRDHLGYIAGFDWKTPNKRADLAFNITSGAQTTGNNTFLYSLVGKVNATDQITYVIQHDFGQSTGANDEGVPTTRWYGLNQYLLYALNPCWSAGLRFEWFRDNNGDRVHAIRTGNVTMTEHFFGNFYELTGGLNWKPSANIEFRPEIRWDFYQGDVPGLPHPFGSGTRDDQLLVGLDAILTF